MSPSVARACPPPSSPPDPPTALPPLITPSRPPPPPGVCRYCWVRDFVDRAKASGALVFLALAGQPWAHGPLQRLLDEKGVPHTGSGFVAAETCADKPTLKEQVGGWELWGRGGGRGSDHACSEN